MLNKRIIGALSVATAMAVGLTSLSATSPAYAGEINSPLCVALKKSLMTNSDIPTWLSKNPDRSIRCSTPGRKSDRPLACFADGGADIWGYTPRARAHSAIKLGGSETSKKAALEAGNTIYSYSTKKKARAAWANFEKKLNACPADATINRGSAKERVKINQQIQKSTIGKFQGRSGKAQTRTLRIQGSGTTKFTAKVSNYQTFRLAGKTIVRVYLNKSTQRNASTTLSSKQRRWVQKESIIVSKRVVKQKLLA